MRKQFKLSLLILVSVVFFIQCNRDNSTEEFMVGGDFSIMKKLENNGGEYKFDEKVIAPLEIFKANGYNYGRLRLFHTPNMEGPVCNSLEYTLASAKAIKQNGMKLLLDIHYSDTWADPQKQFKPKAWEHLNFDQLRDSVFNYTKFVLTAFRKANLMPDIVQVGNEITPGFLWPEGKIYSDTSENWLGFSTLLKAGIEGIKAVNASTLILLHSDQGGDTEVNKYFFNKLIEYEVPFDYIGLSYYPWWHGTFENLADNLAFLSKNFTQNILIVETAYYANGQYPKPGKWIKDIQPFEPTEEGQFLFLTKLDSITSQYPKVKGIFYWKPDGLLVPNSKVWFLGRSLFDQNGNALKGITALKNKNQNN